MDNNLRISLFVLIFTVGLVLGLTFLNILPVNIFVLLVAGAIIGLMIAIDTIDVYPDFWKHALGALLMAIGAIFLARSSLAVNAVMLTIIVFMLFMITPALLAHLRKKLIRTSQ